MNRSPCFSPEAEAYLHRFDEILDDMITQMTGAERNCSISHNFMVQMIPHHQAAIAMCQNLLHHHPKPDLEAIAQSIIEQQTQSIAQMRAALEREDCAARCSSPGALERYQRRFQRAADRMFCCMAHAGRSGWIDRDFLTEMIPHQRGAIALSNNAWSFPICPELNPILCAIVTDQCRGIAQMEQLLRRCTKNAAGN